MQALSSRSKGNGRRLTQREVALMLQLTEAGKSNTQIAKVLDCHESTVGRTLEQWLDNRTVARKYLEANAPKLAMTVVKSKDAATALKALGKLDVVREDQQNSSANVLIAIGQPGAELPMHLQPPVIEVGTNMMAVSSDHGLSPVREIAPDLRLPVTVDSGEGEGHAR